MEKRTTYVEGFGDFDLGDGFQALDADVAVGLGNLSACCIIRFGCADATGTIAADAKFVCGNMDPTASIGWGFLAAASSIAGLAGGAVVGFGFFSGKPVAAHEIAMHLTVDLAGFTRFYVQGALMGEVPSGVPAAGGGRMSIGVLPGGVDNSIQPFGSSADIPSFRNGVAGVAFANVAMTPVEVAEHYRQILETQDVADLVDPVIDWENIWSARRGLPDLDTAGGNSALWVDEVNEAVLERSQAVGQVPAMAITARPDRPY